MTAHAVSCRQDPIRVALATSAPLGSDELALIPRLGRHAIRAEPTVWSDPNADWSAFAGVVIRSCWDYHHRLEEFLDWVRRVEESGTVVINSPALIRWNSSKRYLADLAGHGVVMPQTIIVPKGSSRDATDRAIDTLSSHEAIVVKPAVSASAHDTWRMPLPLTPSGFERIERLSRTRDVVVQAYVKTITATGELSLVFFGGEFSHAVRKRPRRGDFRVQSEHGGIVQPWRPSERVKGLARSVLTTLPEVPVYARVDGVPVDDAFMLMELELIEPELFLAAAGSPNRFADAIAARFAARLGVVAPHRHLSHPT
jgi:glutathione synthase/RimK-type ligase-like ATP-grasp enzyme